MLVQGFAYVQHENNGYGGIAGGIQVGEWTVAGKTVSQYLRRADWPAGRLATVNSPTWIPVGLYRSPYFARMDSLESRLARIVDDYKSTGEMGSLQEKLAALVADADASGLATAVEPFRDMPEVTGPVYERIVAAEPDSAMALVILANAYWLSGRGPDVVSDLATRAIAADAQNRGAWHLWALSESNPRERVSRWQQVATRFADDLLARANLADNAAALAGAEHDDEALDLSIRTYEELLGLCEVPEQRSAIEKALITLRGWRF